MHRLATKDDFQIIYALYMDEAVNPYMFFERMSIEDFAPVYEDMLMEGNRFVYEYEGAVAGVYLIRRYPYRAMHNAYLGGVAMHPAQRGKGLGTKMLEDIFEQLKAAGIRRVELLVETDNPGAIQFYERLGFVQEGCLKGFTKRAYQNHFVDDYLMARYLTI